MTDEELFDYLDGMFAYDTGCIDSGIKDEIKRQDIINMLRGNPTWAMDKLTIFVLTHFLSDEARKQGYGLADVKSFFTWLSDYMRFDI